MICKSDQTINRIRPKEPFLWSYFHVWYKNRTVPVSRVLSERPYRRFGQLSILSLCRHKALCHPRSAGRTAFRLPHAVLLRIGFTRPQSLQCAGELVPRLFILTAQACAAVLFCCTFPKVTLGRRYLLSLPCEARTFLTAIPFGLCRAAVRYGTRDIIAFLRKKVKGGTYKYACFARKYEKIYKTSCRSTCFRVE